MTKRRKLSGKQEKIERPLPNIPARILLIAGVVLAVLTHIAALSFPFVDDDGLQIQSNLHIQSWRFLPQYFTADVWSHTGCGSSNYYRPIFLLWLRLNHMFFELDPTGWHFAAILLHVLAVWLVYRLATEVLNDQVAAGFAATIFAVHPITVEGVVWISGATEALSGVLFLGCMLCYLKGSRRPSAVGLRPEEAKDQGSLRPEEGRSGVWRVASVGLFAVAMWAKETAIVIPLLVLIYEVRFQGFKFFGAGAEPRELKTTKRIRNVAFGVAPYVAVLATYLAVRLRVMHGMAPDKIRSAAPATAIATWPAVLWFYLRKLVLPWPLSLHYSLTFVSKYGMREVVLPCIALLAIGAGLWAWSRREPRVLITCVWLLLPLMPAVAATLRFGPWQLVHDRYLYLSLAGFSMLGALAIRSLAGKTSPVPRRPSPESRRMGNGQSVSLNEGLILVGVLAILGITTVSYTGYWSDGLALYSRAVAVAPDSSVAQNALGEQLISQGRLDEGLKHFQQAIAADPQYFSSRLSLGHAYGGLGQWTNAVAQLRIATQLRPTACAFANLADAQRRADQWTEAEYSYRYAMTLRPCPWHLHWALADLLRAEGRLAEARKEFQSDLDEPADSPVPGVREQIEELDRRLQSSLIR
jgi:tetratricopeptide (TPR) repeat protein